MGPEEVEQGFGSYFTVRMTGDTFPIIQNPISAKGLYEKSSGKFDGAGGQEVAVFTKAVEVRLPMLVAERNLSRGRI